MEVRDLAAHRQTQPVARHLIIGMQAAEQAEDGVPMLFGDADAIVLDRDLPDGSDTCRRHRNHRRPCRVAVFQGVVDEILKQPGQFQFVAMDRRQPVTDPQLSSHLGHGRGEGPRQGLQYHRQIDRSHGLFGATDAGIGQQPVNQRIQPLDRIDNEGEVAAVIVIEMGSQLALEQRGVAGDGPERLAQIVRDGIGELFQIGIGTRQILVRRLLIENGTDPAGQQPHEFQITLVELPRIRRRRTEIDRAVTLPAHHQWGADIAFKTKGLIARMAGLAAGGHMGDGNHVVGLQGHRTVGLTQSELGTVFQRHLRRRAMMHHHITVATDATDDGKVEPEMAPPQIQGRHQLFGPDPRQGCDLVQRFQIEIMPPQNLGSLGDQPFDLGRSRRVGVESIIHAPKVICIPGPTP